MTKKQEQDILLWKYFTPKVLKHIPITREDEIKFLEFSEKGKHREALRSSHFDDGFNALVWSKKYAGISIHELWETGIRDNSVGYWCLLGGEDPKEILPDYVLDHVKKEMFKGKDMQIIEDVHKMVVEKWFDNDVKGVSQ